MNETERILFAMVLIVLGIVAFANTMMLFEEDISLFVNSLFTQEYQLFISRIAFPITTLLCFGIGFLLLFLPLRKEKHER